MKKNLLKLFQGVHFYFNINRRVKLTHPLKCFSDIANCLDVIIFDQRRVAEGESMIYAAAHSNRVFLKLT